MVENDDFTADIKKKIIEYLDHLFTCEEPEKYFPIDINKTL